DASEASVGSLSPSAVQGPWRESDPYVACASSGQALRSPIASLWLPQDDARGSIASLWLPQDDAPAKRLHAAPPTMTPPTIIARVAEIETPVGIMVASASETHLLLLEFAHRKLLDAQLERVRRGLDCVL